MDIVPQAVARGPVSRRCKVLEVADRPAQNHTDVIQADWLDACCWRCGTAAAQPDSLGRLLCPPCLSELSDARVSPPDDPLRVVRGAYWDAHALERCWRCLTESVDPDDEVGLCPACLSILSSASATEERAEELTSR